MTRTQKPRQRDRLRKIVAAFPRVTVTVLGDMVADEFVFGEISRVSREAPVLILRHRERTVVPGGGANAVNNLADLGVNVLPVGVVGNDDAGRLLLRAFRHKRIPVTGILKDKSYPTVTKTRILAGMPHTWRQQVVRVDREPETAPDQPSWHANSSSPHANICGPPMRCWFPTTATARQLRQILNAARAKAQADSVPVVLDSRHRMLEFSGITAATPNEPEVEEALGVEIGQDWENALLRRRSDRLAHEAEIAGHHSRPRRHGCVLRQAQAAEHSGFRQRSSHRRDRRGRHGDRDLHRSARGRGHSGGSGASGQLCRWNRGDEARHRDSFAAGIAGRDRAVATDEVRR